MLRVFRPLLWTFLLLASGIAAAQTAPPFPGSLPRLRSEWFYRQRAYPLDHIPAGARLRALAERDRMNRAAAAASASRPRWRSLGPQPIVNEFGFMTASGRVTALAVDPTNAEIVYLGAAEGGVWKTTDGGRHWTPLTDGQASLSIGSIAIDPQNPSTIYVGTGEANFAIDNYYGAGILKSTDGGSSWTQICGPFCGAYGQFPKDGGADVAGLAVHPTDGTVVLAAALTGYNLVQGGIYRSTDGGSTWTQVLTGNGGSAVLFDPTDGNIAYAALGNAFGPPSGGSEGIFKSADAGQTWSAANGRGRNPLPLTNAGRIVLAIAPSAPGTLFASINDARNVGALLGMFKTNDGGTSWQQLTATPDYCAGQCAYDNTIAIDPLDPNLVVAGGSLDMQGANLIRSRDGGNSWTRIDRSGMVHTDVHALAFSSDGGKLYLGSDGGAWITTRASAAEPTFTQLNSTLSITQFYPGLSVNPGSGLAIGGTQDNGVLIKGGGLGWQWQQSCGAQGCTAVCGDADGGYTAIDAGSGILYAACAAAQGIWRSSDGGANWTFLAALFAGDRFGNVPPLILDPRRNETLYFGTYRVWQTRDRGASWSPISPDLTDDFTFGVSVATAIAGAPSDSTIIYTGTGDGNVWVTSNALDGAGANWTKVNAGLPPRWVTAVAIDPKNPAMVYVAFSGFSGFVDMLGHVFATTDGGGSWADISGNLPNIPVNAVVVDPAKPACLFVGTDIGVFATEDRGKSWQPLGTGLPNVAVVGLTLANSSPATLIAATHGRGAWQIRIPAGP